MTEDTDAQALGMRPADDPAGARAGVPGPADGRHADVVTLRDRLRYASRTLHATDPEHTREWEDCGWGDCVKDRAAIEAAQPAAPEEVCGCGVLWNAAIHSEQYDPEVADFHAPYPPDQPAAPCRCNVGSCFTHPHNPGCAPHGHTVQPAAPEAEPERCCHGYRAPR